MEKESDYIDLEKLLRTNSEQTIEVSIDQLKEKMSDEIEGNGEKKTLNGRVARSIVRSLVVGILLVTVVANGIGMYLFYSYSVNELYDRVHSIATGCTAQVDGDRVLQYLDNPQIDKEYEKTNAFLQTVLEHEHCTTIYIGTLDSKKKTRTYIYDVVSKESGYTPYEIGKQDSYEHHTLENQTYIEAAVSGAYESIAPDQKMPVLINKSEKLGYYIEVIEPVHNSTGEIVAFVCVVKQENELFVSLREYFMKTLVAAVIVAVIAAVLMVVLMRTRFIGPLTKVVEETERFRRERVAKRVKLPKRFGSDDEFAYLANSLYTMEQDISDQIEQIEKHSTEANRMNVQLDLAQQIQQGVLPKVTDEYRDHKVFSLGAKMKAAKQVGGDFYDFYMIDEGHLALTIADVSDKGIAAAMFMMMTKFMLKERTMMGGLPSEILHDVNEVICRAEENENFVTIWLGILNLENGEIVAANAGHEYPIIKRAGKSFERFKEPHGLAVGVIPGITYEDYRITLGKEDYLFLYTDGLAEANDSSGEQYGLDRMIHDLNDQSGLHPQDIVDHMWNRMNQFCEGEEQFDDTTMLCVNIQEFLDRTM